MKEIELSREPDLDFIIKTAHESRREFEDGSAYESEIVRRVHTIDDPYLIDKVCKIMHNMFPNGNCDLATQYLQSKLGGGIVRGSYFYKEAELFRNHMFLKVGELIVDITADQFGGPAVYVGPLQAPWNDHNLDDNPNDFKPRLKT